MAERSREGWLPSNGRTRLWLAGMRARVLVSFLVLLLISTAASVLVLRAMLMSRIDSDADRALAAQVQGLEELAERARARRSGRDTAAMQVRHVFNEYFSGAMPLEDGAIVAYIRGEPHRQRTAAPDEAALVEALAPLAATPEPANGSIKTPAGEARYLAVPVFAGGAQQGAFVAATLLRGDRQDVEDAVRVAIGVALVVLLLASLLIWLAAGRAIAPIRALAGAARSISETDLSRRIPVRGNDEIATLGRTFNRMLDRLEIGFASQKELMTEISHELRTPITVIRGHLETLGDDPAEWREAEAVILDELIRMSRLVDDLLLLGRAPRPDFLHWAPIDLDLLTQSVMAKAESLGDRRWTLDGTGNGVIRADPQRLTQALMNLAENAVRHTGPGDVIGLGSALDAEEARFWVRDSGSGIPAADQARIFERFARTPSGQPVVGAEGTGLGLSIVRAIAEAHDGRVELESEPGHGAKFTIIVPVERASSPRIVA